MERYHCNTCGAEFDKALRRWDFDDGMTATPTDLCPQCASDQIEELERCPTCICGWKRKTDRVCLKCHLRNESELRMFARRFSPAALADLDDMLDGSGLEMFT